MLDDDLNRMHWNPGSVQRRDLVAALREAGFEIVRTHGKHEIWAKGGASIPVPHTLKSTGVVREIVREIIQERRA